MTGKLILILLVVPTFLVTVDGQNMQMWFKKFLKDTGYDMTPPGTNGNQSSTARAESYDYPGLYIIFTKFMDWIANNPAACKKNTGTGNDQGFSLDDLLTNKVPVRKISSDPATSGVIVEKTTASSTTGNVQTTSFPPTPSSAPPPSLTSPSLTPPFTQSPLLAQFNSAQLPSIWWQTYTPTLFQPQTSQPPTPVNPIQLPPTWQQTYAPTQMQTQTPQPPSTSQKLQSTSSPQSQTPQPPKMSMSQTSKPPTPAPQVQKVQPTAPPQLPQFQLGPRSQPLPLPPPYPPPTQTPPTQIQQQSQAQPIQTPQSLQQQIMQTLPPSQPLQSPLPPTSQAVNSQLPTKASENWMLDFPMDAYSKEFMKLLMNTQNANSAPPKTTKAPEGNKTPTEQAQVPSKNMTQNNVIKFIDKIPPNPSFAGAVTSGSGPGSSINKSPQTNQVETNSSLQILNAFQRTSDKLQMLQQSLGGQLKNEVPKAITYEPKWNNADTGAFLNHLNWNVPGQNTKQQPITHTVFSNEFLKNQFSNTGGRGLATDPNAFSTIGPFGQSFTDTPQNFPMDLNFGNINKQNAQITNPFSTHLPGMGWNAQQFPQQTNIPSNPVRSQAQQTQTSVPNFQIIPEFGSTTNAMNTATKTSAAQGQKVTSSFMGWNQNTANLQTHTTTTTQGPIIKDQSQSVLEPRGPQLLSGLQTMISKAPNKDFAVDTGVLGGSTANKNLHNIGPTSTFTRNPNTNNFQGQNLLNVHTDHPNLNPNSGFNFGQDSKAQFQDFSQKNTGMNQGQPGGADINNFANLVAKTLLDMAKQGQTTRNNRNNINNNFNAPYTSTVPPLGGHTVGNNFDPWNAPYPSTVPPPGSHTVDSWNQKPPNAGFGGFFPEIDMYAPMNPNLDYSVHHSNGKNWREMNEKTGNIQMLRNEVTGAEVYIDTSPALGKGVFVIIGTKCWIGVNAQNPDFVLGIRNITRRAQTLPNIVANPWVINAIEQEKVKSAEFARISPTLMEFCEGKPAFYVKPISGQVDRDPANCNPNCCRGRNCCSCHRNIKKQCIHLAVAKYCIIARPPPPPPPKTRTRPVRKRPRP